jgi:hypothetical protein
MNEYYLRILTYTGSYEVTVKARKFTTTTANSSTLGFYRFVDSGDSTIACYPIDKTIIESVEYNCDRL